MPIHPVQHDRNRTTGCLPTDPAFSECGLTSPATQPTVRIDSNSHRPRPECVPAVPAAAKDDQTATETAARLIQKCRIPAPEPVDQYPRRPPESPAFDLPLSSVQSLALTSA